MKYRAIIFDVDGTLIPNRRDGMPSEKVTKAIAKISNKIFVGIATSRPIYHVEHIISHLKLSGPSIVTTGAQIVEFPSKKILHQQPMRNDDARILCKLLSSYKVDFYVQDANSEFMYKIKSKLPDKILDIWMPVVPDELLEKILQAASKLPNISPNKVIHWDGGIGYNFLHTYATKQHGILEVAKILGISTHEIIAVGDGYTDFPLLMACGLKVAMGNAVPDLKAIADYVAPTVEEDGVADVIQKFVIN